MQNSLSDSLREDLFYAGKIFVRIKRNGSTREKILMTQGYKVLLDRNIIKRHAAVTAIQPMAAVSRSIRYA